MNTPDFTDALRWVRHVAGEFDVTGDDPRPWGRTGAEMTLTTAKGARLVLRVAPDSSVKTYRDSIPAGVVQQTLTAHRVLRDVVPEMWGFDEERGWLLYADPGIDVLGNHPSTPSLVIDRVAEISATAAQVELAPAWAEVFAPATYTTDYAEAVEALTVVYFPLTAAGSGPLRALGLVDDSYIAAAVDHDPVERPRSFVHGPIARTDVFYGDGRVMVGGWREARFGDSVGQLADTIEGLSLHGPQRAQMVDRWLTAHDPDHVEGWRADLPAYLRVARLTRLATATMGCIDAITRGGRPAQEWVGVWRTARRGNDFLLGTEMPDTDDAGIERALRDIAAANL